MTKENREFLASYAKLYTEAIEARGEYSLIKDFWYYSQWSLQIFKLKENMRRLVLNRPFWAV